MSIFPYLVAGWVFLVGVYGIVTTRNLIHAIVSLAVVQSSTYILLLGVGYQRHATAPVFDTISTHRAVVDPVVQAMTLTDIVVSATGSALLLALALQARKRAGTLDPDAIRELRG